MFRFNPSLVLLAWMLALLALISMPWPEIAWACATVSALVACLAPQGFLRLLRRSRWLLLTVVLMFGWMTPGMPVSGLPGATIDGLLQAAEQFSRLVISIAMVAALLSRLDTPALLAGCHGLLRPLRWLGLDVGRLVLRLALTLRQLDGDTDTATARPAVISIPQQTLGYPDLLLMCGAILLTGALWL